MRMFLLAFSVGLALMSVVATFSLARGQTSVADSPTPMPNARDVSGGYGPIDTPAPTIAPPAIPVPATPIPAPTGYPGQSNLVPDGFPTPNTAFEQLRPAGPPRDPGSFDWARPGPFMAPKWSDFSFSSFTGAQKIATTYYFYWHDLTDPTRLARFVSRFNTPPNPARYNFLYPDTHYREFSDMLDAGLDFVLPVYWGEPGHPGRTTSQTYPHSWSTEGIPPMVEALDRLWNEGRPLRIGLFYDTTILANADLRSPAGKEYFYINVRDFYSRIPPKYWAGVDGKPVVWLYDALWVASFDQSSLDYLSDRFAQDFGGRRLFIVREAQWEHGKHADPQARLVSDGLYSWGAGPSGFNTDPKFTVAQVGPGFKNTQYCTGGPERNCFDIDREGGGRYEGQLQQAIATNKRIIAVETWNEFSEGTDIAETDQTGRTYINLSRTYLDKWRGR